MRFLALAVCVALAGCAAHDDFVKAQSAGTLQAWADYVKKYPAEGHPSCDDCRTAKKNYDAAYAKEKSEFETARDAGTARAYLRFLDAHGPESPFYQDALKAAHDHLMNGEGAEGDYQAYLAKHTDDTDASEIRRALMNVRLENAKAADEAGPSAYFIAQYPGTAEASKLSAHWAAKEFEKAKKLKTRLALEFFLKRFPNDAHADQAQSLLSDLPRSEPVTDDGSALELLPKLREASAALRGQECLAVLADTVRNAGSPYAAAAERVRAEFAAASDSSDIAACRNAQMRVPAASRPLVSAAVRALVQLSKRRARLTELFAAPDAVAAKTKKIGKSASELSETAEAFDLEMQAYFGYMPADPDKPQEKAAKDAAEALRRAQRAYELTQGEAVGAKKKEAADVVDVMNGQEDLLIKLIAFNEKPERRTP